MVLAFQAGDKITFVMPSFMFSKKYAEGRKKEEYILISY